jgi:hypothetical protein
MRYATVASVELRRVQVKINRLCRASKAMFVSCDVYGLIGSIFVDLLGNFQYKGCAHANMYFVLLSNPCDAFHDCATPGCR